MITTKLAAAIYGGVANNKYKYSIQYCPCGLVQRDVAFMSRVGYTR